MMSKILKDLIILIITIGLILFLSLRVFTYWFWSEWDIDRTLIAFQQNRDLYNALVVWADDRQAQECIKQKGSKQCLPQQFNAITNAYTSISYNPLTIEAAPVNFYYVLVYTKNPKDVKESGAYHDEGKILQTVERNWTLVRRGWM